MSRLFGTDGVRGLATAPSSPPSWPCRCPSPRREVLGEAGPTPATGPRPSSGATRAPRASSSPPPSSRGWPRRASTSTTSGVLPTPAVAYLTADTGADFGVMLSASHNAMPDNGIKFFARGGHKLPDEVEDRIESAMGERWDAPDRGRRRPGRARCPTAHTRYIAHLLRVLPNQLDGLRVVIDGAHGAASMVSPEVFRLAGAEVVEIGTAPDGLNINDGFGSTHLDPLKAAVVARGAALGIAHDGDADRCLAVDATGTEVDGDQIMGILAVALKERGALAHDTLVATVMSNLGLLQAMEREGIRVLQTGVGDRYVLEEMRAGGYSLGGEQSGHVIMLDHGTTGDGVLTGLMLAARVAATGRTIADLGAVMTRLPQVLVNIRGVDKSRVESRRGAPVGHRPRGGRARRLRPGAAAQVRHRAARAGHGRGADAGAGGCRRDPPRRGRAGAPHPLTPIAPDFAGCRRGGCRSAGELGLDVAGDLQGRRGRGRRGVEQVDHAALSLEQEVIDERAVRSHRLGTHASRGGGQVLGAHLGNEPPHSVGEAPAPTASAGPRPRRCAGVVEQGARSRRNRCRRGPRRGRRARRSPRGRGRARRSGRRARRRRCRGSGAPRGREGPGPAPGRPAHARGGRPTARRSRYSPRKGTIRADGRVRGAGDAGRRGDRRRRPRPRRPRRRASSRAPLVRSSRPPRTSVPGSRGRRRPRGVGRGRG